MYDGIEEGEIVNKSVLESTTASGELYSSADDNIEQRHRCMNRSGHPDDLWSEDSNNLSVQPTLGSQLASSTALSISNAPSIASLISSHPSSARITLAIVAQRGVPTGAVCPDLVRAPEPATRHTG